MDTPNDTPLKQCSKCKQQLPATKEYFSGSAPKRDGLFNYCKQCEKAYRRLRRKVFQPIEGATRECIVCRLTFPHTPDYFPRNAYGVNGLSSLCKTCSQQASKRWHANNRDYAIASVAQRRRLKGEADAIIQQKYRRDHPEKYRIRNQRRYARQRALASSLTEQEWAHCLNYFHHSCAVCGRAQGLWHILALDHWIPLNSTDCPGTVAKNIIPLCHGDGGCNNQKLDKPPTQWLISKYGERKAKHILGRIQAYFDSLE